MLRKLDEISIYIFDHIWMLIINECPQRDTKLIEYNIILHIFVCNWDTYMLHIYVYIIYRQLEKAGTISAYSLKNVCV